MDFKVAGYSWRDIFFNGYHDPGSLQNDWSSPISQEKACFGNLTSSKATIPEVRPELVRLKIDTIKIDVGQTAIVIGKGGETLTRLSLKQAQIDIDEEGNKSIYLATKLPLTRA